MFSKEGPVFWGNLWLMKVDVLFVSFFTRNDNISFWMEFCKRGVIEKSLMDSSDCEESVLLVNPGGIHTLAGYC